MGLLADTQFVGAKFFLSQWKATDTIASIEEFANRLTKNPYFDSHVCLLAVPFSFLRDLSKKINNPRIILGANSMLSALPGTFTASISGAILKKHSARFVLVGSAKGREIRSDEASSFKNQIKSALESGITPFYCIGETHQQLKENHSHEVLLQQCKEALTGLSKRELSRLCIVYEAPWMVTSPEKFSLDQLSCQYKLFKQAVGESVDPEIFPNLKLIDALPQDIEEANELLEQIPDKGLYTSTPEAFFSLLNEKCAEKLKVAEILYTPEPSEPEIELPKEEIRAATPHSTVKETAERSTQMGPAEAKEKEEEELTFDAEQVKIEEEVLATAEEEETVLEDALKNARELQPYTKEATRKELEAEEDALGLELNADEDAEVLAEDPAATQAAAFPQELPAKPATQVPPTAPFIPVEEKEEEAFASASKENDLPPLPEEQALENQEPQELQELQMKLQHLNSLDKSLADCYQQIHERMEALPALRQNFPELLNKMTIDLNKLDPALQEQINRGNIAFFTENPDKMREAAGVLVQIQEINLLLQKTAAIPREVDRILSKSREIRKALEAEWSYFRISRQRIKENYPDFHFPAAPSQLMIPEPKTDLTPAELGSSGLVNKRIAVVKTPPMA